MARNLAGQSFSSLLRDEWVASPLPKAGNLKSEIRGILDGMIWKSDSVGGRMYSSGRLWIFRRLSKLWEASGIGREVAFGSLLTIPPSFRGKVAFRLPETKLPLFFDEGVGQKKGREEEREWLKGLWGSSGSLYLPKTGYYMNFLLPDRRTEIRAAAILKREGVACGQRFVSGRYELTLRNQEEIVTLLSRFGLVKTPLSLEEKAIVRSMRDWANKIVNCDSSNIRKSLEAAARQIEIARAVLALPGNETLPEVLKALIACRIDNPSANLEELGNMQSPPVSKSTIKYRWKKLEEMIAPLGVGRSTLKKRRSISGRIGTEKKGLWEGEKLYEAEEFY
ncbi:MAG: DNA-binding protein WhiA [Synergistaceae bacterium]|nr:DNA-binding protein WhiA [Synergistaceae bacterium]